MVSEMCVEMTFLQSKVTLLVHVFCMTPSILCAICMYWAKTYFRPNLSLPKEVDFVVMISTKAVFFRFLIIIRAYSKVHNRSHSDH